MLFVNTTPWVQFVPGAQTSWTTTCRQPPPAPHCASAFVHEPVNVLWSITT
jgi:hypothetical protein